MIYENEESCSNGNGSRNGTLHAGRMWQQRWFIKQQLGRKTAESGSAQATSDSGEAEDIVFAIPLSKTVDMSPIEDEVNKITENKLNVHVKSKEFPWRTTAIRLD